MIMRSLLMFSKTTINLVYSLVLISVTILPTFADSEDAFEHLYEVMDNFHDSFDIYTDQDSGGNHYIPSGWMGDTDAISLDTNWKVDCYRGTSCIRVVFTANANNWAGIYWQAPENNWGNVQNGGYDLRGATQLSFWAKGAGGGEQVEFFLGGITGNYGDSLGKTSLGFVTLSNNWSKYTIDLEGKNLEHVVGAFGWVTNAPRNPTGATFYLDEIHFDKMHPAALRFLGSYKTLATENPDRYIRNVSFLYDNALSLLAFLARGEQKDLRRAGILADTIVYAQENDRYYTDGRLRNAYMSGDLIDDFTGKARLPGWWNPDAKEWNEDEFQVSTHTGNLAWALIALLAYYEQVGDQRYLNAGIRLGEWIQRETHSIAGSGGYTGGYQGWEPAPSKLTWKSTEHNIDVFVAFSRLFSVTKDSVWQKRANHAKTFIEAMWNSSGQHFWTGTNLNGIDINKENIPVDIQAWAVMALDDFREGLEWAEANCRTAADGFIGFDFNNDKDGVWFEGTAQMSVAYQMNTQPKKANFYIEEMRRAQLTAKNNNGQGIVASSRDGLTTGFDWEYFSRVHIGATAWYLFAKLGYNPYWGTPTGPLPGIAANDVKKSLVINDGEKLIVSVELDSGSWKGKSADWWLMANTPLGSFYYDASINQWSSGNEVSFQGTLSDLNLTQVLNYSGLPVGTYQFQFGVDMDQNGLLDEETFYRKKIEVNIISK